VGVARLPRVCRGVRGAGARSQVRNGVRGFPGQCPALDSAAHALASRTTPESFVTRAPPREGRGSVPCRKMARGGPMKMGTIASLRRYDVAAAEAIRPDNLRRTAILRYASWAAVFRMSRVVRLPFDGSSHFDQSRVRPDGPFQASQSHSRNRAIGFGPW